jgi:hypothetical protein
MEVSIAVDRTEFLLCVKFPHLRSIQTPNIYKALSSKCHPIPTNHSHTPQWALHNYYCCYYYWSTFFKYE